MAANIKTKEGITIIAPTTQQAIRILHALIGDGAASIDTTKIHIEVRPGAAPATTAKKKAT